MHFQQTQEFVFCAPLTVVAAPRRHGACNVITVVGCAMLLLDGFAWLMLAAVKRLTNMVSLHYYTVCLLKSFRYTVFALLSHAAAVIHRICVLVSWVVYATLGSLTMTILLHVHHNHIRNNKPNSSKNILFTYASATHIATILLLIHCNVCTIVDTSIIILLTRTNSNSTSNYITKILFTLSAFCTSS